MQQDFIGFSEPASPSKEFITMEDFHHQAPASNDVANETRVRKEDNNQGGVWITPGEVFQGGPPMLIRGGAMVNKYRKYYVGNGMWKTVFLAEDLIWQQNE